MNVQVLGILVVSVVLVYVCLWKMYSDSKVTLQKLGRSTWMLLHTVGASYPEEASLSQQELVYNFLNNLAKVYPCPKCGGHMQQYIAQNPITLKGRKDLMLWLCNFHNSVNKKLGKNLFDCEKTNSSTI